MIELKSPCYVNHRSFIPLNKNYLLNFRTNISCGWVANWWMRNKITLPIGPYLKQSTSHLHEINRCSLCVDYMKDKTVWIHLVFVILHFNPSDVGSCAQIFRHTYMEYIHDTAHIGWVQPGEIHQQSSCQRYSFGMETFRHKAKRKIVCQGNTFLF